MPANGWIADDRLIREATRAVCQHFHLPENGRMTAEGSWEPGGLWINTESEVREVVEVALREAKAIT